MPQPPLLIVKLLFRSRPELSPLERITNSVSEFLDTSVALPLHLACRFESLTLLERIWNSTVDLQRGQDPTWSVRSLLRTDCPHYHAYQFSKCLIEAVRRKNLTIVKWLFEHFPNIRVCREVVEEAASVGAFDILQYFYSSELVLVSNDTAQIVRTVTWGGLDAAKAAEGGHSETVQWLYMEIDVNRDDRQALYCAVTSGDAGLVEWLQDDFSSCGVAFEDFALSEAFAKAAAKGHFEMIKQYFVGEANGAGVLLKAAENGHLKIVRWLVERDLHNYRFKEEASEEDEYFLDIPHMRVTALGAEASLSIHAAASNGHLDVAKYLRDHVEKAVNKDNKKRENHGKEATLLRLSSYGFEKLAQPVSNETMLQAAKNGHLEAVKWLYSEFGTNGDINLFDEVSHRESEAFAMVLAMDAAAMNGHLDIVQYLHELSSAHDANISRGQKRRKTNLNNTNIVSGDRQMQHAMIKCTSEAMDGAAANNHLEMVKWLRANRDEGCTRLAMVSAAGGGHIEMMQWLHDNCDVSTSGALDAAAMNGRLDSLKWLQQHAQCDVGSSDTMDIAASRGHLEVLKWLHQHTSASCTTQAMDGAADGGHLDVIKWLHRNRSEGCTSVAMAEAATNGHWHVMKWLHEHVPDDCSSPVIDHAARACHFECVLFLNRSRQEMVSEEVAHSASSMITNPGLQNWVLENLGRGF